MNDSSVFNDSVSFDTTDSLRSFNGVVNSTQYCLQDDDFFLVKVTEALFEDFQVKCSESENMDDQADLVALFYEVCSDGISAFQRLSLRPDKGTALSSVLQQLVQEQKAYYLLLKLAKLNNILEELKDQEELSILANLLLNNWEFRKLQVLLEWCEENAYNEPETKAELSKECEYIEKNFTIRAESLHGRLRGEKFCDLDLDGALHGRLHSKDEKLESRVHNVIYTLIRCGRLDEASEVLQKVGLSALVPSLQLRQMSRAVALTPSSKDQRLYYLAQSRAFLMQTIDKVISKGTSLSQVETCLWSVMAGRLEPALSLSSRTEDRLWCYLNAAVETRLNAAIFAVHNGVSDEAGDVTENDDLRIDSIFDEIATHERSPYYTIYRHLVKNDSLSLIASMDMWLEQHIDYMERFPHIIRFMAHIVLLLSFTGQPLQEESANSIIQSYVRLLITMKLYTIVPYYASKLPPSVAEEMTVDFMCQIEDDSVRREVLGAVCAAKLDSVYLCKQIFLHIRAQYPVVEEVVASDSDDVLINAWSWLTYSGSDTHYDALIGMDEIMRDFFYADKLDKAKNFLEGSKKEMDKILETFVCVIDANDTADPKLSRAVAEYKAYECYLEALVKFNEWFKNIQRSMSSRSGIRKDDPVVLLDMQQRITFEVAHQKAKEQLQRYENAAKQSSVAAMEALMRVLLFPHGWMNFTEAEISMLDKETVTKFSDIRTRYVTAVVIMLLTLFEKTDTNGPAKLAELLADEEYMLAEIIPKERLRVIVRQLSISAYKYL